METQMKTDVAKSSKLTWVQKESEAVEVNVGKAILNIILMLVSGLALVSLGTVFIVEVLGYTRDAYFWYDFSLYGSVVFLIYITGWMFVNHMRDTKRTPAMSIAERNKLDGWEV